MTARPRLALATCALLVVAACGGDGGGATVSSDATTTTAAAATTTSTVAPATGPLAGLEGVPVEDPLLGSGFHEFEWADDARTILRTPATVDGPEGSGVLYLGPLPAEAEVTGLGDGQVIVSAWVEEWPGDVAPAAFVMYSLAGSVWEATVPIRSPEVLTVLEGTTDYFFAKPDGPAAVGASLVSFDWTGTAEFVLDVAVYGVPPVGDPSYLGQLGCTYVDMLECITLSDDGVLRPGDEGEDVEALQQDLTDLGYLSGPIDGRYGDGTAAAVRALQRDFWLTRDGRAGPQTLGLIDDLLAGTSGLVLIDNDQIGSVSFATLADPAYAALVTLLGPPDSSTGWYVDPCDGHDWLKASWGAFTAIFTDRDGPRQLDGWEITDLPSLDPIFRIGGGIRPTWRWSDFEAAGAVYDPGYGEFFVMFDLEYNNGRFADAQGAAPSASAVVVKFGTGTGAFVSC